MGFETGHILRVTLKASAPPSFLQVNTFHYDLDDSHVVPGVENKNDPQALADYFRDNVVTQFRALYTSAWTIDPVVVMDEKDPQNPNVGRGEWVSGSPLLGTRVVSGQGIPFAMCGVATLKTDAIGRRHTGRTFLGGHLTETDLNGNQWEDSIFSSWGVYMTSIPKQPDIATGTSGAKADWCVYSRTQRGGDFDPYASHVQSATVHRRVHWLRSRDD